VAYPAPTPFLQVASLFLVISVAMAGGKQPEARQAPDGRFWIEAIRKEFRCVRIAPKQYA